MDEASDDVLYPSATASIAGGYNLGGDSDSEESDNENCQQVESTIKLTEMNELKRQTDPLLERSWKEIRDKKLLLKLLELEEPTITPKMVDFLLLDGVTELLLSFITQLHSGPRPSPQNYDNEGLKLSYKATILITADEPSEPLQKFLSYKVNVITKSVFNVFLDYSAGSFYHCARILETLLRLFPAEVYNAMIDDGLLESRMDSLLRYIGCVPVADVTVMLVCMSPIHRQSHLYSIAAKNRYICIYVS